MTGAPSQEDGRHGYERIGEENPQEKKHYKKNHHNKPGGGEGVEGGMNIKIFKA